ncbi:MAG: SRPBCC family protein [Candidatus Hermodarchaeota archaeon]
MPRVDRKTIINAPPKNVYAIIEDRPNFPKWNVVIKEMTELETDKWAVKSTVGDLTSTRIEAVPYEKLTDEQDGPMTKMGYIFKPEGNGTEVTLWGEFDEPSMEMVLGKAGEFFLECLKKYAEYLEAGGNPEDYKK